MADELLIGPPSQPFIVDPPPAPPPTAGGFSAEAYARQLLGLLPRGLAWVVETGDVLDRVLLAVGEELARVDARADAVIAEADPRRAVETLDDWERVLGLPDECAAELPPTIENRQRSITQRLASRGGQTAAFYIDLVSHLGVEGAVVEDAQYGGLRVGFRAGDRAYGNHWAHVWSMVLPSSVPLEERVNLECAVRRAAPAHTVVLFSYE